MKDLRMKSCNNFEMISKWNNDLWNNKQKENQFAVKKILEQSRINAIDPGRGTWNAPPPSCPAWYVLIYNFIIIHPNLLSFRITKPRLKPWFIINLLRYDLTHATENFISLTLYHTAAPVKINVLTQLL